MPSIEIADKTTLDAVNTKVGTNADAADTSTLFARLAQIAGYTDTLETLIGTANPASGGTDTLFEYLKKVSDAAKGLPPGTVVWSTNGTTDASNTLLDISGSGWLLLIYNTSTARDINIQMDGGTVQKYKLANPVFFGIRFNSSLLVTSSTASADNHFVVVVLD